MSSIVTLTFSPCIDKSTRVQAIAPEIKLKCAEPVYEPGGGGINVARAIQKLHGNATAIYPAGGYNGKRFTRLLGEENVPSVIVDSIHETRENIIVLDETSGLQYRFNMPCPPLTAHECNSLLQETAAMNHAKFIVVSGSLPEGISAGLFTNLAEIAHKNNARLIADCSGPPLKEAMNNGAWLVKPSLHELCHLTGHATLEGEAIEAAAQEIIQGSLCEVMVVSLGSRGALLVTKNSTARIEPPPVATKSTVGAGDSLVAGIVLSLSKGLDLLTAVMYGVACGTAATLNPGTQLCNRADAEKIFAEILTR